jgi:hypothetical protein
MVKVKAQGVLVASVLMALVSLSALPGAVSGKLTSPAGRGPSTQCDCETR